MFVDFENFKKFTVEEKEEKETAKQKMCTLSKLRQDFKVMADMLKVLVEGGGAGSTPQYYKLPKMTSRDNIEAMELYTQEQEDVKVSFKPHYLHHLIYECRHGHVSGWKIFGPRNDLKRLLAC